MTRPDRDAPRMVSRTNKRLKTTVTVSTNWPWVHAMALNMKTGRRHNVSIDASQTGVREAKKQAAALAVKEVRR